MFSSIVRLPLLHLYYSVLDWNAYERFNKSEAVQTSRTEGEPYSPHYYTPHYGHHVCVCVCVCVYACVCVCVRGKHFPIVKEVGASDNLNPALPFPTLLLPTLCFIERGWPLDLHPIHVQLCRILTQVS